MTCQNQIRLATPVKLVANSIARTARKSTPASEKEVVDGVLDMRAANCGAAREMPPAIPLASGNQAFFPSSQIRRLTIQPDNRDRSEDATHQPATNPSKTREAWRV